MTNLDSILKSRHITLPTKVHLLKAMIFPGVMYECEKAGLKLNIQKTKIMASSPIPSWQIEREKVETVKDFIFLSSKIIAHSDFSPQY